MLMNALLTKSNASRIKYVITFLEDPLACARTIDMEEIVQSVSKTISACIRFMPFIQCPVDRHTVS